MKLLPLRLRKHNRNKLNSLPFIKKDSTRHNNSEISYNNISNNSLNITTKVTLSKNNSISVLPISKLKKPRKIKLNKSLGSIEENIFFYPKTNTNNDTLKIIERADDIINKRKSTNLFYMEGSKNFSRKFIIGKCKEISKKNYKINHLKKKRTEINLKSYFMEQAIKNFNTQFSKDYNNFKKFISKKKEDLLEKAIENRKKTESILKQEQILHDSLMNLLIKQVKSFYVVQKFGSFFHELIGTPFLYDKVQNNDSEKIDFEFLSDKIINIYESKEKYLPLPKELNDDNLLDNKCIQLEEMILNMMRLKQSLEKELIQDIKIYNRELKLVEGIKRQYERDLDFVEQEKIYMSSIFKKSSVNNYEDFDYILKYILELGKELNVRGNNPEKSGENFYEYINYGRKTAKVLEGLETKINGLIGNIENIENIEKQKNEHIMEEILINQKIQNKKNIKLYFKRILEQKKLIKDQKTMDKGKKMIIRRRLVFSFSQIKHHKKIKKVIIKQDNDDNEELYYSESEKEKAE